MKSLTNAKKCYCQWINLEHFKNNGHCNNNPLSFKACVKHTTYECKVVCERCGSYEIVEWKYYNYMKTTILQVATIRGKEKKLRWSCAMCSEVCMFET